MMTKHIKKKDQKEKHSQRNYAFIDGQNLFMGANSCKPPWKIDLIRFRVYLREKYLVQKAYYYIGYIQDKNKSLYEVIQEAGFILQFRKHNSAMKGKKKGNVDSDIIFDIMYKLYKKENFDKIVLVSGDGDYKMLVDFLIEEKLFEKILFPNRQYASSLYKQISAKHFAHLDTKDVRKKIGLRKNQKEKKP